jgi:hypothetical protein
MTGSESAATTTTSMVESSAASPAELSTIAVNRSTLESTLHWLKGY